MHDSTTALMELVAAIQGEARCVDPSCDGRLVVTRLCFEQMRVEGGPRFSVSVSCPSHDAQVAWEYEPKFRQAPVSPFRTKPDEANVKATG